MNKLLATLIVSAGVAAAVPLAAAQTAAAPDTTTAQAAPQRPGMHQRHHGQRPHAKAADRIEARLAYIRTALKITDAQQPQWNAFADVLRKHAARADERRAARIAPAAERQPVTAIERLERRQQRMSLASQRLDEVIAAAKPLYAALSPEQQKLADEMLSRHGRGGQGHGRHGHHHKGPHRGA